VEPSPVAVASGTIPARIHADREARTLAIEWRDGHATLYDFVELRWLCPCAYCRGEAAYPWLDSLTSPSPDPDGGYRVGACRRPTWATSPYRHYTFRPCAIAAL
jgi:hypothetical protein